MLRDGVVRLEDQVRVRHWLAELLEADIEQQRRRARLQQLHAGYRGELQALRRAPRSRVRRRPGSDRAALLHELGGAQFRATREFRLSAAFGGNANDRYTPPPEPERSLPPLAKSVTYCRPSTW